MASANGRMGSQQEVFPSRIPNCARFENRACGTHTLYKETSKPREPRDEKTKMSGRYAFTQTVKELRFLFCQSSEHSAAVR